MNNPAPPHAASVPPVLEKIQLREPTEDPDAPRVPIRTSYKITREQETALCHHIHTSLSAIEDELGRSEAMDEESWHKHILVDARGERRSDRLFMPTRVMFQMMFNNRWEWRPSSLPSPNIFEQSNLSLPVARRITRQLIGKAIKNFFSSDPWISAYPLGPTDEELARAIDKFLGYKMVKASSKAALSIAIRNAFIQGESVVKIRHAVKDSFFEREVEVLVDPESGLPFIAQDGDYITTSDKWIIAPSTPDESGQLPMNAGATVLARDGVTPMPKNSLTATMKLPRRQVHYSGPEISTVHYRDFLCGLAETDIHAAPIIAHIYDMPVMNLVDFYGRNSRFGDEGTTVFESTAKMLEVIDELRRSGDYTSGERAPRPELGQTSDSRMQRIEPTVEIAEAYLHWDANGDGVVEHIMVVMDRKTMIPLFYDYVENVTPKGRRPFEVIRINPVDGRWHGQGSMEQFEQLQLSVDLMYNRMNYGTSTAGRLDIVNAQAIERQAGNNTADLQLNNGKPLYTKNGFDPTKVVHSVYFENIRIADFQRLLEQALQLGMNESGVATANDGYIAGMDTTQLATGIKNIENAGDEVFAVSIDELSRALTEIGRQVLHVLFANMDEQETFTFFEGTKPATLMIRREDVSLVDMDVQLVITRYKNEQMNQASQQAIQHALAFYSLPLDQQRRLTPLFQSVLTSLNVPNVDEIISPLPMSEESMQVPMTSDAAPKNSPAPFPPPK